MRDSNNHVGALTLGFTSRYVVQIKLLSVAINTDIHDGENTVHRYDTVDKMATNFHCGSKI